VAKEERLGNNGGWEGNGEATAQVTKECGAQREHGCPHLIFGWAQLRVKRKGGKVEESIN